MKNSDQVLASYMASNRQGMENLLRVNGVIITSGMPKKDLDIAFLKAITDSDHFRHQLSGELSQWNNFVDNSRYLNETGDPEPWLGGTPKTTAPATTTTTKKQSFLGSIFTPELIQTGIKTGLDTISTNNKTKAQQMSEQNALELERLRLQQIEAAKTGGATGTGMSTGAKVAIGVGAAIVVGVVVWLVVKAKKKG